MPTQNLFSKILSLLISGLLLALFIYFLPTILVIFGVILLLLLIATFVLRFMIKKNMLKMNWVYSEQTFRRTNEEIPEMKDVTNSSKNKKA